MGGHKRDRREVEGERGERGISRANHDVLILPGNRHHSISMILDATTRILVISIDILDQIVILILVFTKINILILLIIVPFVTTLRSIVSVVSEEFEDVYDH